MAKDVTKLVADLRKLMLDEGVQVDEPTGVPYFTGYSFRTLYSIDLYFETITMCYLGIGQYAKNGVGLLLSRQRHDGFTPRTVQRQSLGWSNEDDLEHCQPFLAQTCLLVGQFERDFSWISREMFRRLRRYLNYWLDDCDRDGNGLSEWNSAEHGGADNQYDRLGARQAYFCEAVDLNCYLHRECLALARLADELGERQQAIDLRDTAAARRQRIREVMWDEAEAMFYDRDRRTGATIRIKYLMSFMSLWAEVATEEQARASVTRHLLNPQEFWLPFPAATLACTEQGFMQEHKKGDYFVCNFRGSAWIPYNYWIMHGLRKYGSADAAAHLADRSYDLLTRHEAPREWYNSETGEGYGHNPFWGFSSVAAFMPLELEHGVDPTALNDPHLRDKMDTIRGHLGAQ